MQGKWIALAVGALLLLRARAVFAAKPGTVLSAKPEIQYARGIIAAVWRSRGYTLTVTSGYDGEHREGSLHYDGYAEDYRTRDVAPGDLQTMVSTVRARLGTLYDVVLETQPPHLHVEYDPRNA